MKILLVEDNEYDVKLALHELESLPNKPEIKIVDKEKDFQKALKEFMPDVIITDYVLPDFDGMRALKISLEHDPFLPVIIFTGSINEEVAVECIKAGATDYVLKSNYKRLPFAVKEALGKREALIQKIEAERKLKESENLFRTLAETSIIGIYLLKDWKFVYVNDGFLNIFGFSRNETINKLGPLDLVTPEVRDYLEQNLVERLGGKVDKVNLILKARTKKGQEIFIEVFSRVIELNNEKHIIGAVIDITDRVLSEIEVQKSELLFRTVWENSMDAMRLVDENGIVVKVNQAYLSLFKVTEDQVLNKPFYLVYDESSYNENITQFSERIKTNSIPPKIEMDMTLWNKEKIYIEARNKILFIDNKKYVFTIFRDMTERRKYEMELIKAKEEALEMSRLKSNFLANMSHEIRTPLNGMIGFSELLKEQLNGEYKEWATIIHNGSLRLLETLNTILDYSQIEADKVIPYLTEFDVKDLTENVVRLFSQVAHKKGLSLNFYCNLKNNRVKCDEKLYRRIATNLINNAVKFTFKGEVNVILTEDDGNFILRVQDTGIGIPEDKFDYIFLEFRQVSEGLGRQFEGTGLGLTIVKKYVEKLNGKIEVRSKVGEGSTFTVYLPKNC